MLPADKGGVGWAAGGGARADLDPHPDLPLASSSSGTGKVLPAGQGHAGPASRGAGSTLGEEAGGSRHRGVDIVLSSRASSSLPGS